MGQTQIANGNGIRLIHITSWLCGVTAHSRAAHSLPVLPNDINGVDIAPQNEFNLKKWLNFK